MLAAQTPLPATATPSTPGEDSSNEIVLLRTSLATLASELQEEKQRSAEFKREQDRLRAQLEETRRKALYAANDVDRTGRRSSQTADAGLGVPIGPRRASLMDSTPRRRSSLGLSVSANGTSSGLGFMSAPPPPSGFGLGLAVDSPLVNGSALSTSPNPRPLPLHRLALRRGSNASAMGLGVHADSEEDERLAKLRELRQGLITTKVASRRGSLARGSGLPDFAPTAAEFEWLERDAEARRRLSMAFGRRPVIRDDGEESDSDRPPSAPLRAAGRNNSMAMFENWSRRSSTSSVASSYSAYAAYDSSDAHASMDDPRELRLQLEGLRIQLAESEEGRRASELCLRALKDFVAARTNVSLPPMPSDANVNDVDSAAERRPSTASRWSIPRLSFSTKSTSPNLTSYTSRRTSSSSVKSHATPTVGISNPTAAPIFGGFSFSALMPTPSTSSRPLDDSDVSPSMGPKDRFGTPSAVDSILTGSTHGDHDFPREPSPLCGHEGVGAGAAAAAANAAAHAAAHARQSSNPDFADMVRLAGPLPALATPSSESEAPSLSSSRSSRSNSPVEEQEEQLYMSYEDNGELDFEDGEPRILVAELESLKYEGAARFVRPSLGKRQSVQARRTPAVVS